MCCWSETREHFILKGEIKVIKISTKYLAACIEMKTKVMVKITLLFAYQPNFVLTGMLLYDTPSDPRRLSWTFWYKP